MNKTELFAAYAVGDYETANNLTDDILRHSEGKNIGDLLFKRNPSEPAHIYEYRMANLRLFTKTYIDKIVSTISKITKAADFTIRYKDPSPRFTPNLSLQDYCEGQVPNYGSVLNWFAAFGVKALLTEPNGVVVLWPEIEDDEDEMKDFIEVYIKVFKTENVLGYCDDFVFLRSEEPDTYYLITEYQYQIIKLVGNDDYQVTWLYEHNADYIPAFRLGGVPVGVNDKNLYESFIAGVVPYFDEAFCEQSDKQGAIKQHIYPERLEMTNTACDTCNGTGKIGFVEANGKQRTKVCGTCNGTSVKSVYATSIVRPPKGNEQPLPFPNVVYVEKDIAPVEFLDKDIQQNIYNGLAAVHFEFLANSPLAQSGVAKAVDREPLNAFLGTIAEYATNNLLKKIYFWIAWLRYAGLFNYDKELIKQQLPEITIPEVFDVYSAELLRENIKRAKETGLDASIIEAMELQLIEREFRNEPSLKDYLKAVIECDPQAGRTTDEKMALYADGVLSFEKYYLSANIQELVRMAAEKDKLFYEKSFTEKMETLYSFVPKENSQIQTLQDNG